VKASLNYIFKKTLKESKLFGARQSQSAALLHKGEINI